MTDREEFEKWAQTDEGNCALNNLRQFRDEYVHDGVQRDWLVWQAARATAEPSEPDANRLSALCSELDANRRGVAYVDMPIWDAMCEAIGDDCTGDKMRNAIDAAIRALKSQQGAAIESKQAGQSIYPDDLTPELREVLGWPNFKCAPIAHLMVAAGAEIKPKSEDEQAAVLHWLMKLVFARGKDWKEAASADIRSMQEAMKSAPPQKPVSDEVKP